MFHSDSVHLKTASVSAIEALQDLNRLDLDLPSLGTLHRVPAIRIRCKN